VDDFETMDSFLGEDGNEAPDTGVQTPTRPALNTPEGLKYIRQQAGIPEPKDPTIEEPAREPSFPQPKMLTIPSAFGGDPLVISEDAFRGSSVESFIVGQLAEWQKAEDARAAAQARDLEASMEEPIDFSELSNEAFQALTKAVMGDSSKIDDLRDPEERRLVRRELEKSRGRFDE